MTRRAGGVLGTAIVGAAGAAAALRYLSRHPPGGADRWERTNFRGRRVDLLAGPAVALGATTALVPQVTTSPGGLVAVVAGAGLGLYDDLAGGTHARGLRGHLRALQAGEITSGLVKLGGLAMAGVVAAALPARGQEGPSAWDALVDGLVIAGAANLVNLLDLRPGRALKVAVAVGGPIAVWRRPGAPAAAAAIGAAVAVLPDDLGEHRMIGDCGANALGALVGWAATQSLGRPGRLAVLGGVTALTLASERVSFSAVIDNNSLLHQLDMAGRAAP